MANSENFKEKMIKLDMDNVRLYGIEKVKLWNNSLKEMLTLWQGHPKALSKQSKHVEVKVLTCRMEEKGLTCSITLLKRCWLSGRAMCNKMSAAPLLCPNNATWSGSPPKFLTFLLIHWSTVLWSFRPWFPENIPLENSKPGFIITFWIGQTFMTK